MTEHSEDQLPKWAQRQLQELRHQVSGLTEQVALLRMESTPGTSGVVRVEGRRADNRDAVHLPDAARLVFVLDGRELMVSRTRDGQALHCIAFGGGRPAAMSGRGSNCLTITLVGDR